MPTDAQLLARISSDATGEALRALYRAYAGELYGFALNALGDRGTAEEAVQEVFTRAWRHAEAYDPTRGSVRTWLYQIARHAIIDARRRASVRPALPLHEPTPDLEPAGESLEQAMLGWQVVTALDRLSPEHRQMIRLAHLQGLTMREIAERCNLPVGTVKSRTWYALRALRLVLEEMGGRWGRCAPARPGPPRSAATSSARSSPRRWRRSATTSRTAPRARPSTTRSPASPRC